MGSLTVPLLPSSNESHKVLVQNLLQLASSYTTKKNLETTYSAQDHRECADELSTAHANIFFLLKVCGYGVQNPVECTRFNPLIGYSSQAVLVFAKRVLRFLHLHLHHSLVISLRMHALAPFPDALSTLTLDACLKPDGLLDGVLAKLLALFDVLLN